MAKDVYDKRGDVQSKPGSHDDLGIHPEHREAETQDLEGRFNAPSAADPHDLRGAEESAKSQPDASPTQNQEHANLDAATGGILGRAKAAGQAVIGSKGNRKSLMIGGGSATVIVGLIILMVSFASTELVGWRENMLGRGNQIANTVLDARGSRSFARLMRKMKSGAITNSNNTINDVRFKRDFENRGYRVVFSDDKKLQEFSKLDENGNVTRSFNLDEPDTKKAVREFTEGVLGEGIQQDIKEVVVLKASQWKGRAARRLWRDIRVRFTNWADRETSNKADTDEKKLAENLRAEEADQSSDPANRTRASSDDSELDADGDGEPDPGSELNDPSTDLGQEAEDYRQELLDDPGVGDEAIDGVLDSGTVDELANNAGGTFDSVLAEGSEDAVRSALGEVATKIPGKVAGAAVTGISVTDWYNRLCRVKGTLLFVANVRNVMLSIELAKFTLKFLTLADHQKAGALSSDGLNIAMKYLHTPSPFNGRGYYESGGIQNLVGNSDVKVSQANLGRYSTGRANAGVLAQVANFMESNPLGRYGVNPTACRVTNNGFVQLAGAGVGIVIAVFGGAETGFTEAQIATSIGLAVAEELVFQIAKPMLIKVGARMLFNGLEGNGEQVGDGLASGMGATKGMNGGANGLRPVTWEQAGSITREAEAIRKDELARMNPFERYFSFENPDSLTSQAYFATPKNFAQLFGKLPALIQPEKLASSFVDSVMPKKVAWAQTEANTQCQDEWIRERHLATDAFCNVEMGYTPDISIDESEEILLGHNQIDVEGNPIPESEYEKYIEMCHSGASTVIYKNEVSDAGTEESTQTECITPGDPLPGDTIGKHERFTAFYGYTVDEANLSEEINDKYIDEAEGAPAGPAPGGPVVAGGPCPTGPVGAEVVVAPAGTLSNVLVHPCVVQQVNAMVAAAAAQNVTLTASNSWRDPQEQIQLREAHCGSGYYNIYLKPSSQCSPPTATPGNSRHERGLAIDFSDCSTRGTDCYRWLAANAQQFGYFNLPSEPWHWSVDGK